GLCGTNVAQPRGLRCRSTKHAPCQSVHKLLQAEFAMLSLHIVPQGNSLLCAIAIVARSKLLEGTANDNRKHSHVA
ncbi:MAG: hypothetical protein ACKPKO_52830, partial [Candidatus Fonsibacter sp.]